MIVDSYPLQIFFAKDMTCSPIFANVCKPNVLSKKSIEAIIAEDMTCSLFLEFKTL